MPLYRGGARIAKLYRGATPIVRAYKGAEKVFDAEAAVAFDLTHTGAKHEAITGTASYTLTSIPAGEASAGRAIIATVGVGSAGSDTGIAIGTVTIGGVSATEIRKVTSGTNGSVCGGTYIAAVPTGTTVNVTITASANFIRVSALLHRMVGYGSLSAHSDNAATASQNLAASINVPAGGGAVAGAFAVHSATNGSYTWSGLTENYDNSTPSQTTASSAHQMFVSAQTGLSVGANLSASPANSRHVLAMASFGP